MNAANELRESINGDLNPKWVEVWAHIDLGKTLGFSGQLERSFNEFRQALRTGDNTFGAQDEVAGLLKEMGREVQTQPRIPMRALAWNR